MFRLIDTWGERTKSTMTLVHGDFRAENIFFDEEGQVAAMVDFQVCKEGTAVGLERPSDDCPTNKILKKTNLGE